MPEINTNQVKGPDPKQTTTEPRFQIPARRRGYSRFIIIPIVMIIFGAVGWFVYGKIADQTTSPDPVVEQPKVEEKIPAGTAYYLASDSESGEARLYQFNADTAQPDKKIAEIKEKNVFVLGKYVAPYTYVINIGNDLLILDAKTGKTEKLFTLPDKTYTRAVAVSSDKQWLAYAQNYEGSDNGKSGGEIFVYNIETKEQKQIVKKTELGLYQGYSILGWRDNDKELIVNDLGGDAGAVWGNLSQVNVATGTVTKVAPLPEKEAMDFLRGQLSPDGNKWLFEHCEKPDLTKSEGIGDRACASGAELRTYDFDTKEIKTVYQNLRYDNNVEKNSLRVFIDFIWQDDSNIIASVPGAILDISIGTGKAEEIYKFDGSNPQNYKNHYLQIENVNSNQIVFTDEGNWNILDLKSGKVILVNKIKDKEVISYWLN